MPNPAPPILVLSARDRYARENGLTIAGPSEHFVAETVGPGGFIATDNLALQPPPGSKVILAGQAALTAWRGRDADLNTARAHVKLDRGVLTVATYLPIDCIDVVNHEAEDFGGGEDDESPDDKNNGKDSAPTSRKNFRFWFGADVRKLLLHERMTTCQLPQTPLIPANENIIDSFDWSHTFIDIETHPPTNTVQCLSIAGIDTPVFTFPVWDHRGAARGNLPRLFAKLVKLFSRTIVIGHNVSFDLGFLAHAHRIPWPARIEDTMVQHHRCFPESEKSLAHVISYWTNMPYHKDMAGTFTPYNAQQYNKLLTYNAADVATTRLVWLAQREWINQRPGLAASVRAANASIEVYLRAGLTGFSYNETERLGARRRLGRRIAALTKLLHRLVGYELLPSSPAQLADYFYVKLKYPVAARTDKGAPSTDAKTLYRLTGANPQNAALRVLLELRDLEKQEAMLKFKEYYRIEKR